MGQENNYVSPWSEIKRKHTIHAQFIRITGLKYSEFKAIRVP